MFKFFVFWRENGLFRCMKGRLCHYYDVGWIELQQSMEQLLPKKSKAVQFFLTHKNFRIFFFQFILCAFLTFMCLGARQVLPFQGHPHDKNMFVMIYVALVVYIIICFGGPITGAHINPAVTLAFFVYKKYEKGNIKTILSYMSAQLSGCLFGCILSKLIYDKGGFVYPVQPEGLDLVRDCVSEVIGTFLLILIVFIVTTEETTFVYGQAWTHLIIGLFYYFCLSFSPQLHSINPAIIFSFQAQGMIFTETDSATILSCLALILSQLLGGFLAQLAFKSYQMQTIQWKSKFK